ncbi:unnamed protein product, partial [Meganyctiphanes norvegica]
MLKENCLKPISRRCTVTTYGVLLDYGNIMLSTKDMSKEIIIHLVYKFQFIYCVYVYVYMYMYAHISMSNPNKRWQDATLMLRWTQFCLLVAPEVATFWNVRKRLLRQGSLRVDTDLQLTRLVLSKKPKCMEVFQHRKWMFHNILAKRENHSARQPTNGQIPDNNGMNQQDIEFLKHFLFRELELCTWASNKHQNNYHSWNHRLWVMQQFGSYIGLIEAWQAEYQTCHNWVSTHVSEHSGLHYIQYLLDCCNGMLNNKVVVSITDLVPDIDSLQKLYLKELNFNLDLITEYNDHEALFCHRRFILTRLRDLLCVTPQRTCSPPPPALKRSCVETVNSDWSSVILGERQLIDKCIVMNSYQKVLGEKHAQWLNNVLAI